MLAAALNSALVLILVLRVIARDLPASVAMAWIATLILIPYAGPGAYLLLGEQNLAKSRRRRAQLLNPPIAARIRELAVRHPPETSLNLVEANSPSLQLMRLVEGVGGFAATSGNQLDLIDDAAAALRRLSHDIDQARETCHMLFFIWSEGGVADEVALALERAAQRGVRCRVLLDQVGSRKFLGSDAARRLRAAGVQVRAALPVSLMRVWIQRLDLRNHRKVAVIDGRIAYTGSLNIADPEYFRPKSRSGAWVDILCRIHGPSAETLDLLFLRDWKMETNEDITTRALANDQMTVAEVTSTLQVLASGPDGHPLGIHEVIMALIYGARRSITITTPYFVPSEGLLKGLASAALRGVQVNLLMPSKLDSRLAQLAGEACFAPLSKAGVRIAQFKGGLLHAKTLTIDDQVALIGTVNLDMRSLFLNFEVSLLVYDARIVGELVKLQRGYLDRCQVLAPALWLSRPRWRRGLERTVRLVSPLL